MYSCIVDSGKKKLNKVDECACGMAVMCSAAEVVDWSKSEGKKNKRKTKTACGCDLIFYHSNCLTRFCTDQKLELLR